MAEGHSLEMQGVLDGANIPASLADGRVIGGRVRAYVATLDMADAGVAKADGDTNVLFEIPAGEKPFLLATQGSATMGAAATIAIGNADAAGKYRAAAVHTTTTLNLSALTTFLDDAPLAEKERVILTVGAAALPGAGTLSVIILTTGR